MSRTSFRAGAAGLGSSAAWGIGCSYVLGLFNASLSFAAGGTEETGATDALESFSECELGINPVTAPMPTKLKRMTEIAAIINIGCVFAVVSINYSLSALRVNGYSINV